MDNMPFFTMIAIIPYRMAEVQFLAERTLSNSIWSDFNGQQTYSPTSIKRRAKVNFQSDRDPDPPLI